MIQLPEGFIQLRYPGYYWNVNDKTLYSCKQTGVLKPMVMKKAYRGPVAGGRFVDASEGYSISVNGIHKKLSYQWLCSLKVPNTTQIFPVADPLHKPDTKCNHDRQLWKMDFSSGHCQECGTTLQGNPKWQEK